jgi:hypothetical protein
MDIYTSGHYLVVEGEDQHGNATKIEHYVRDKGRLGDDLLEIVNSLHKTTYHAQEECPSSAEEYFEHFKFNATDNQLLDAYEELKKHFLIKKLESL